MVFETYFEPLVKWLRSSFDRSFYLSVMATAGVVAVLIQNNGSLGYVLSGGNNVNMPWLFMTVVTTGLIFFSYYLGGIFNSKVISENEYGSHAVLRLQSQARLLPISELIRKQGRKAERERIKNYQRSISDGSKDQLRIQADLLAEAILDGYVFPWYHQISEERLFPTEAQLLLQEAFRRLRTKIDNVDRTSLMVEVVETLHCHWNEYCSAIKKIKSPNELLIHKFKLAHEYIENREEVRKQYENMISMLLPDLLPNELQSPFLSKFISGILVKGIVLYYVDLFCDPKWLNTFLVTLISSGNYVSASDTGSNPSGSNISSVPPSPSSTGNNTPPKDAMTPNGDDARFMEAITSRVASLPNFLETKTNGQERTIETALSGLLSTTALPLLPEGMAYTPGKDLTIQFSHVPKPTHPNSPSKNRHKSWEEAYVKPVTEGSTPSGGAKSFDESQGSPFVTRQSEFDCGLQSPAYEEAENFAATIAKLRSLLEQRESQTNIIEGLGGTQEENTTVMDSPAKAGTIRKGVTGRGVLDSQSSGSSLGSDGSSSGSAFGQTSLDAESKLEKIDDDDEEDVNDECDLVISRFFQDVSIPKTESCGESNDQFTLYCIQYTGVYIENERGDNGSPKLVLRTTTVKRSLNEFLLLQTQLEKNPDTRGHLRGIKSHNTWLSLPFTHRRILLQRYLQQLSIHPVLGFCPELRQFMAYGDDGFQMFAPFPSGTNHLPRFDRLTKTFTGVLTTLRDALPSFADDADVRSIGGIPRHDLKPKKRLHSFFQFGADKTLSSPDTRSDDAVNETEINIRSEDGSESGDGTSTDSDDPKKSGDSESDDENAIADPISATPGRDESLSPKPETSLDAMYPLATAVTRFLCDVLWLPEQRPKHASVSAVMSVSGKSLEKYLTESLDILLSEEAFLGYMELLTVSIRDWTATVTTNQSDPPNLGVEDLKLCLKHRLPTWVRWVWGRSRLELTIERLAEFFQIPSLNHDFLLSIIELTFTKLRTK